MDFVSAVAEYIGILYFNITPIISLYPAGVRRGSSAIEWYTLAGKNGEFNKYTAFVNECFMNIIGTRFM